MMSCLAASKIRPTMRSTKAALRSNSSTPTASRPRLSATLSVSTVLLPQQSRVLTPADKHTRQPQQIMCCVICLHQMHLKMTGMYDLNGSKQRLHCSTCNKSMMQDPSVTQTQLAAAGTHRLLSNVTKPRVLSLLPGSYLYPL